MNFKNLLFGAIATLCFGYSNTYAQEPSDECTLNVFAIQGWDCEGEIVNLDIQGGTPFQGESFLYKIDWFKTSGPAIPSLANQNFVTELPRDLYDIIVTDALGCKTAISISAFEGPERLGGNVHVTAQDTINSTFGTGSTGVATIDIVGGQPFENTGYTYKVDWFVKGGDRLDQFANQITASDLTEGTYQVFVSDVNGCCLNKCFTVLKVSPRCQDLSAALRNARSITEQPTTDGASVGVINISAALGNARSGGPFKIDWFGPDGQRINRLANRSLGTDLVGGTYTLSITAPDGCQSVINIDVPIIEVDCNELVEVSRTVTPSEVGLATGSISLDVTGGTQFQDTPYPYKVDWFIQGGDRIDRLANQLTGDFLAAGTYQIMVWDFYRCCLTFTIEVPEGASTPIETIVENGEDETIYEPETAISVIPSNTLAVNAYPNPVSYQSGCEMNLQFEEEIQGVIEYYEGGVKKGEELVNGSTHRCDLSSYSAGLIHIKITSDKGSTTVSCINLGCSGK